MHPFMPHDVFLEERRRELERNVRYAHHRRQEQLEAGPSPEPVTLRVCRSQDDDALRRLALLSGCRAPRGWYVVAEAEGAIVAALPLAGGTALADPFQRTAHLVPLLELRAHQITGERPARRRLGARLKVLRWSRA